jgi:hypothetical protein
MSPTARTGPASMIVTAWAYLAAACGPAAFGLAALVAASPRAAAQPVVIYSKESPPATPTPAELPLTDTVTRHGITWKFSAKARVGRFVNGDYYVAGPVTVTQITPEPADGRNQSALNLPVNTTGASPFDDRVVGGRGQAGRKLRAHLPVRMKPGDALISSISVEPRSLPDFLRPPDRTISPVGTVSVLTCLTGPVPPDAFRPSYCDRRQRIYLARNLRRGLLPKLSRRNVRMEYDNGGFTLADWVRAYERPWLDVCFFSFDAPARYQPQYGRELGRAAGISTLLLMLDFTAQEKEPLLVGVVQRGIDLWGIARAGHVGWPAHGGHGTGRKLPIVFAGILLDDREMQTPAKKLPKLRFGEDMQTVFAKGWTGARAVYAGHVGAKGLPGKPDWGAYEHLPPARWPGNLGENYRRCCTSLAWVAQALALRLLHAEKAWGHDAFFVYVDRWMTEDDTQHVAEIKKAKGWDYSKSWQRQRQCWDPFVEDMWRRYRNHLPAAPDGHKDPKAEETWK